MLMRFNFENFLSFNENQEFSLSPGKAKTHQNHLIESEGAKLLRFGAVYGANASGKSNFVKALHCAQAIVLRGIDSVNCTRNYFRLNESNKQKSTQFEFEIKLDGKCYAYGFKAVLSTKIIEAEWLYETGASGEELIFERVTNPGSFNENFSSLTPEDKNKLNVYIEDISGMTNTLFVSEMARKSIGANTSLAVCRSIFDWFRMQIQVVYPNTELGGLQHFFVEDETIKLAELLEIFDTGITRFKLKDISEEELYANSGVPKKVLDDFFENFAAKNGFNNALMTGPKGIFRICRKDDELEIKKLFFEHGSDHADVEFEYQEESDGTRRLIDLLMIIQKSANTKDKIFIVDELDRSLHPQLSKKFIELFFKVAANTQTQLIITTHESELMDLALLRRDEIWFVERDEQYQSRMFSLDEFKERYDKKVNKAYLEGRYGALPVFRCFESLAEELSNV